MTHPLLLLLIKKCMHLKASSLTAVSIWEQKCKKCSVNLGKHLKFQNFLPFFPCSYRIIDLKPLNNTITETLIIYRQIYFTVHLVLQDILLHKNHFRKKMLSC